MVTLNLPPKTVHLYNDGPEAPSTKALRLAERNYRKAFLAGAREVVAWDMPEPEMIDEAWESRRQVREAAQVVVTSARLFGIPDLVVEVISSSTEEKDTNWLWRNYYQAGIPEYWLIDARPEEPQFGIWKRTEMGYRETQSIDGWQSSSVLGQSFRLTRKLNRLSIATYRMEMR